MAKYKAYDNPDGSVCIADQAGWLPGAYESWNTAVFAANNLSEAAIIRWLEPIYSGFGEDRAVTITDVNEAWEKERANPTPEFEPTGLTDQEKLAKIEEMMHPGYWSGMDPRREKILKVLGSTRQFWDGGNPFEDN